MTTYVIYRHGSNAANQSMTNVAAVDIVEAKSKSEAIGLSRATCYSNQKLTAKPVSRVSKTDYAEACDAADLLRIDD